MITLNSYLNFNGNTEQAFNFYKSVFGGEFQVLQRFSDIPPMPDMPPIADADKQKLMHVSLAIGPYSVLMGTDVIGEHANEPRRNNQISISINIDDLTEGRRVFNDLAEGGSILMPFAKAFWGATFGMFTDRFGIQWMVNCETPE